VARIITISIPEEDDWVYTKLKAKPSISNYVVKALKEKFLSEGDAEAITNAAPDWYIPGFDYSHLSVEEREELRKYGYTGP
jgi:hypothetical protein